MGQKVKIIMHILTDTPSRTKIIMHVLTNTPPKTGEVTIIKAAEKREKKNTIRES